MATAARLQPSGGQQTQMQSTAQTAPTITTQAPRQAVLRLRGAATRTEAVEAGRPTIRWAEDVVDNEGMGRKSSKGEI